jgi:HSP20 family protein
MPNKKRKSEDIPIRKRKEEIVSLNPSELISEIDRLFDDFRTTFQDIFSSEKRWTWPIKIPRIALPEVRAPFCDLIETDKEYRLCAEMPGISKDKIDINIDKKGIEISAEAKSEVEEDKKGYVNRERNYSSFYRRMTFPEEVIPEKAEATYENGVLEITIPKKTPTDTKKHKVKVK